MSVITAVRELGSDREHVVLTTRVGKLLAQEIPEGLAVVLEIAQQHLSMAYNGRTRVDKCAFAHPSRNNS